MNTLSFKTKSIRKEDVNRQWYIIDAEGEVVGRLCTRIAHVLRGKHKPDYTPHVDNGDFIIVINAEKIRFTGDKMNQKEYTRYTGYPGGLKKRTAKEMIQTRPIKVIETAVKGMLPKTKLGNQMFRKLFVYEGAEHPHQAQKAQEFKF
ncbi:MAG TPA: 50S ribosomal protein L13 [Saprospirales bacterium]|nr:50S ribosomal protein L13 [Saprospirales bacterium]HAY70625.1 50S ribosomal protein L13 [Saprospirales bacterium]HRQ30712.1 50S ribosomal protein L13 [Saprospiraceae bacterium]